jgi:hypothetical protein
MYFQILRSIIRGTDELFKIHETEQRVASTRDTDIDEYEMSDDEHVNNSTIGLGLKRKIQETSVEQQLLLLRSLVEGKENDNPNKRHEQSFEATPAEVPAEESSDEDTGGKEKRFYGNGSKSGNERESRHFGCSSSSEGENSQFGSSSSNVNSSSSSSSVSTKAVNFGREANRNLLLRQLQDHNNGAKPKEMSKEILRNQKKLNQSQF